MALTRFTLRQLEVFTTVAQLHSFSMAAQRLGLTAQAVSQSVNDLEVLLGFRLFDRTTRRVTLSSAGKDFLPSAETVLRHVQASETAADDVRNRAAGLVRIGAPQVLACSAIPAAIREHRLARPKVAVRVQDVAVDHLVERVAAGDIDLAIGPDRETGDEVQRTVLCDNLWVLYCSADHPLAQQPSIPWRDLHRHALVAAGLDHERGVAQMHASLPEGTRVTPVEIVDHTTTALGLAVQGLAATLAPAYVGVLARPMGLVMRRVVEPEVVRKICLYHARRRSLSPAAEGFAEHLRQWVPQWLGAMLEDLPSPDGLAGLPQAGAGGGQRCDGAEA